MSITPEQLAELRKDAESHNFHDYGSGQIVQLLDALDEKDAEIVALRAKVAAVEAGYSECISELEQQFGRLDYCFIGDVMGAVAKHRAVLAKGDE